MKTHFEAQKRTRCLQIGRWLWVLIFAPAGLCACLLLLGHPWWALLLFCIVLTTLTFGTLVPSLGWFGPLRRLQLGVSTQPLLTIDDGPHPEHTPAILRMLDEHGLKAIFFLIGEKAEAHPHLVAEILRRGHEIGNHTQTHPAKQFWALNPRRMWEEIAGCQETLLRLAPGYVPRYFRPPAGHHNPFCFLTSRILGLEMLMWTARGFDGTLTHTDFILRRIQRKLTADGIVLIHEGTPVTLEVAEKTARMVAEYRG
jgi:peptidoglycan-N-acetylglucosamine deacetylase